LPVPGQARTYVCTKAALIALTAKFLAEIFSATSAHAQDFQALGYLPGDNYSVAYGVSGNGSVVVGISQIVDFGLSPPQPFSWTASGGMVAIGNPPGGSLPNSIANAANSDGSVIVGFNGTTSEAFRATSPTNIVSLGTLPGSGGSRALGVSGDGSVVVGQSYFSSSETYKAFRWTASTGMTGLGTLPGDNGSAANAISADGSVIVGFSYNIATNPGPQAAFRWTQSGGMTGLGFLPGMDHSIATAVNANGSVIVGNSYTFSTTGGVNPNEAFRWTNSTGMVGLGYLPGGVVSIATGVSADGSVVVGQSFIGDDNQAFRWTQSLGMQSIAGILSANGDSVGMQLNFASGVSADGITIVGSGTVAFGDLGAWVARIPINAFALLDMQGVDHALGSLVWGGTVTNSGSNLATLSVGSDNTSTAFKGTIKDGTGQTALTKVGTGTTALTGANTYTGATSINAGVLEVDGSIASSSLTSVNNGGALIGVGTVGNTQINSGGIFAPGAAGVPGTSMTVQGNLAFQSGALYFVQINPATSTSANVVTGTATLAGDVVAYFAPGKYMMHDYTILQSTGLHGTFDGLATVNLPADFIASLKYTGDDVMLNITANLPLAALNGNQRNVATALNNFFNSGGTFTPNFLNLFGLTGSNLANALSQLSGEAAADGESGAFHMMTNFLGLMLDPSVDGRNGGGGQAIGFAPAQEASFPPDIALAYASVLKAPPRPATPDQRWSAWGSAFGGSNTTNGDPVTGTSNVTASIYGFAAGMDYRLSSDTMAGFALAGGGTNWGLAQGLGGGRSDAFQVGVYGKTRSGPAYLAAALAFTNNWMTTNRNALGDQLTANFSAQSYGGRLEAGYRYGMPINGALLGVTPYAALQTQSFHTPSYSETDLTGGGFGLSYNAMNAMDTRSELGARFDDLSMLGAMPLTLRARVAWAHDWVSNPSLGAVFQALPGASFTVNGATPPPNSALASAGAELHITNNWSLAAKFDGEFAPSSQTYAGTGTIKYVW
jgi:autotransporter-associated beta strand protein/probable HAF family extracellular repeat protein